MGICLLVLLLGTAVACDEDPQNPASSSRPNIIVIVTDDQPLADTLEVMPATRRLFVEEGTLWSHAFATTPNCCPSRASIFTGRYAHNHGVRTNSETEVEDLDQSATIQRHLQAEGYFTAIVGKFLNKWDLSHDPPHFDRWAIHPGSEFNREYYHNGRWNIEGAVRRVKQYSTSFVRAKTLEFLDEATAEEEPWFLYVAPLAPHADYDEPPIVEAKYRSAPVPAWDKNPAFGKESIRDKPAFVEDLETAPTDPSEVRRKQLRSLMSVDDMVEDVFEKVEEAGEREDTLAIFLSDNGYLWGEHGLVTKLFPYTPSVQIPLAVRWPGEVAQGRTDDRLAANLDVGATVLDAAGMAEALEMDGHSLLDPDWDRDRLLLEGWGWAHVDLPIWASLRTKTHQYIEYYRGGRIIARELYDVNEDPFQLTDLTKTGAQAESAVPRLSRWLREDRQCRGPTCP